MLNTVLSAFCTYSHLILINTSSMRLVLLMTPIWWMKKQQLKEIIELVQGHGIG